jgi:hypothetical protein
MAVQGEARSRPAALAPTADAGVLRCPGCRPDRAGQFIGRVLRDTRQRAAVKRDDLEAQRLQGVRPARGASRGSGA